jgi:hypothetical protein
MLQSLIIKGKKLTKNIFNSLLSLDFYAQIVKLINVKLVILHHIILERHVKSL